MYDLSSGKPFYSAVSRELGLRFHPERGWYRNSRPKMGEWKRWRAWDWIEALTLKQMVSEGTQSWTQVPYRNFSSQTPAYEHT